MSTQAHPSSEHAAEQATTDRIVAIYDGQCVLCRQSKRTITWLDWLNNVQFLDLHDWDTVHGRYPNLDKDDLMGAMHIITRDGRALWGFEGLRYVARYLPLGWLALPLLYFPGMGHLGPRLYGWVARHRYQINKLVGAQTCDEDGVCKIHT